MAELVPELVPERDIEVVCVAEAKLDLERMPVRVPLHEPVNVRKLVGTTEFCFRPVGSVVDDTNRNHRRRDVRTGRVQDSHLNTPS